MEKFEWGQDAPEGLAGTADQVFVELQLVTRRLRRVERLIGAVALEETAVPPWSSIQGQCATALQAVTLAAGSAFPWGTWLVNVLGSGAIGAVSAAASLGVPGSWSLATRHAVMTGVLGGFTTFSTFSVQTVALCQQGRWRDAAAYVVLSVGVSLAACILAFTGVHLVAR